MSRTRLDRFSIAPYEQRARILRSAGSRMGYTDRELGELAGMTQSDLSMKLSGKRKWKLDDISALDKVLTLSDAEIVQFIRAGRNK